MIQLVPSDKRRFEEARITPCATTKKTPSMQVRAQSFMRKSVIPPSQMTPRYTCTFPETQLYVSRIVDALLDLLK